MNNLTNYQGYVTGLKKSGLHKGDMVDYIAGIFNNQATRNDCLAFCLRYINPKQPEKIVNEADFRRMLRKSDLKTIREVYFLAQERYKHVSRYRDDRVNQYDKTLSQLDREKQKKEEMKKENFDDQSMNMDYDTSYDTGNFQQVSTDLVDRLGDIETHLRDLVSSDQIQLNQDQMDAIAKLEKINKLEAEAINESKETFGSLLETLSTIEDDKVKLLVFRAKMFVK
jgi:hypothetical protein